MSLRAAGWRSPTPWGVGWTATRRRVQRGCHGGIRSAGFQPAATRHRL